VALASGSTVVRQAEPELEVEPEAAPAVEAKPEPKVALSPETEPGLLVVPQPESGATTVAAETEVTEIQISTWNLGC
jgi:hypothetical protein